MGSLLPFLGLRKSHCSRGEVERFQVSEFLYMENECLKVLFTNNSHASCRPKEGALVGGVETHYHPQSFQLMKGKKTTKNTT